jgi:putative glutamine transport system substrate-binding protein
MLDRRASGLVVLAAVAVLALLASAAPCAAAADTPAAPAASTGTPRLHGDSWAEVEKSGHGTLVVPFFYPLEGFAYRDANGKLTGLMIDMIEQFRSYLKNVRNVDVTLRLEPYEDFSRFYDDVRQGEGGVIGLAGTTINATRAKEVAFGPPFFSNVPVLVTNALVPDIESRERIPVELAGYTALAFRGTTLEAILHRLKEERFPTLKIESIVDYHEIVRRLSQDPHTFAYLDLNIFWTARKLGAPLKRQRAGDEPREDFGFILPLRSDWRAPLDGFFAANGGYRNGVAYRTLMIKHLGVDLHELLQPGR